MKHQAHISSNSDPSNHDQVYDERTEDAKKVVKVFAILEIIISLFTFCCGVVEVSMTGESCHGYYSCNEERSAGQGIWCSIFPFIAGIFGIVASKTYSKKLQIRLLLAFSIVGIIAMLILAILEMVYLHWRTGTFRMLQIVLFSAAAVNLFLLIFSSGYGCFLACCNKRNQGAGVNSNTDQNATSSVDSIS